MNMINFTQLTPFLNFLVAGPIAGTTVPNSRLASQRNFPGQSSLLRSNNKAGDEIPPALEVAKEVSYL